MFFGIPLHPKSREYTTFTWQGKRYRFLRLPRGYIDSPIIARSTLITTLRDFKTIGKTTIYTYIDDILIAGQDQGDTDKTLQDSIERLKRQAWTTDSEKITPTGGRVKILGVYWNTKGPQIPDIIIDKIQNLKSPTDKSETQRLLRIFGYWRRRVPYLFANYDLCTIILRKQTTLSGQKNVTNLLI